MKHEHGQTATHIATALIVPKHRWPVDSVKVDRSVPIGPTLVLYFSRHIPYPIIPPSPGRFCGFLPELFV